MCLAPADNRRKTRSFEMKTKALKNGLEIPIAPQFWSCTLVIHSFKNFNCTLKEEGQTEKLQTKIMALFYEILPDDSLI